MYDRALLAFIEQIEQGVARWQTEGLSADAALKQSWAVALLDLEESGVLPKGYLRCRVLDDQKIMRKNELPIGANGINQ